MTHDQPQGSSSNGSGSGSGPGSGSGSGSGRAARWTPWILALVAAGVRIAWVASTWNQPPVFTKYLELGRKLHAVGWIPEIAFASSPLYIYIVGLVHGVFGLEESGLRCIHAGVAAITVLFAFHAVRRLASSRAATVTAVILALYPSLVLYDTQPMTLAWVNLANAGALYWLARTRLDGVGRSAVLAGVALGLSALLRPNALLWLAVIVQWLLSKGPDAPPISTRIRGAALLVLALVVTIAPVTVINSRADGELVLVTASGGSTLYGGNNTETNGVVFQPPTGHLRLMAAFARRPSRQPISAEHQAFRHAAGWAEGRPVTAAEAARFWRNETIRFIQDHPGPFIELVGTKLRHFVHSFEIHDTASAYVRGLPLTSASAVAGTLVGALAGLGLFLGWRRRWHLAPVLGLGATYVVSCLVFYVNVRLRLPAVLPAGCLAGVALTALVTAVRARSWRVLTAAGAGAAALAVTLAWPTSTVDEMRRYMADHYSYYDPAVAALRKGDLASALALFEKMIARQPNQAELVKQALGPYSSHPVVQAFLLRIPSQIGTARPTTDAYHKILERGYWLYFSGKHQQAVQVFSQAVAERPGRAQAYYFRGLSRLKLRRWAAAQEDLESAFRRGKKLEPNVDEIYQEMALAAANAGRRRRAAEYVRRALFVNPHNIKARALAARIASGAGPPPR